MTTADGLRDVAAKWWTPPEGIVAKLPRITCPACSKKNCQDANHKPVKCKVCDAFISPRHIHLDFVGHADLTRALIEIDPDWNWEPVSFDDGGSPRVTQRGNMWVLWGRLTLLGKTLLCVGTCESSALKSDVDKELIGDLLRNGAMRFGIFGALWSKTDGWHDDGSAVSNGPELLPLARDLSPDSTPIPTVPATTADPHVLAAANPPEKPLAAMTAGEMARYGESIGVRVTGSKADILRQLEPIVKAATGEEPFDLPETYSPTAPPPPGYPIDDRPEFDPVVANTADEAGSTRKAVNSSLRADK